MPNVLYHYCPLDAFLGIVQSKEIWLTNIFCMNDAAEHYWLRSVARDVIEKDFREPGDEVSQFLASALFPNEEKTDLYCCCLSKEDDSLGQWRAYADDGRGVALGLSKEYLRSKGSSLLSLEEILYVRTEQEKLVKEIIERNRELLQHFASEPVGSLQKELALHSGKAELWHEAVRCKNPCFQEEREVRLIYRPTGNPSNVPGEPQFRARGDMLVPYYALPLPADTEPPVICEVVFGPKNARKHNEKVARMLLSESGYNVDRIRFSVSRATYR